jgi:hypothetical protein
MKLRRPFALTLGALGFCSLLSVPAQGPDDKGSVFRNPFAEPAAPSSPPPAAAPRPMPEAGKSSFPDIVNSDGAARRLINPDDAPDINRDIQVTPAAGNWLIMVIDYISSPPADGRPGRDGAVEARKMCFELRNKYRVPAFVFQYGKEERRKEYDRVKKIYDQQQKFFKESNFWPEQPLRYSMRHIDVQHAVLMGGYPDVDAANRALVKVHKWELPDPSKVALETIYYQGVDPKARDKKADSQYLNPFKRAFACRNPSVKQDAQQERVDVAALKRLNADESYSLFTCKKPFTLAVKEFQTPHSYMMPDRAAAPTVWDKLTGSAPEQDVAKINAHRLAQALRAFNLEAFVLHSKYSSSVTVGSFDGPNDPALIAMQDSLAARFNRPEFAQFQAQVQFFHRPVPMAIPR